jgi:hypothetical protein
LSLSRDKAEKITILTIISFFIVIVTGAIICSLLTYLYNSTPRYEIYPVTWIDGINIKGTPFKEESFNVTIAYALPNSCGDPYSQEFEVDNATQSVEFRLFYKSCINCICLPAIYYYNHTFSITLQFAGNWTLKAGELTVNITVFE